MTNKNPLFLYEEVMLLALRDDKGTVSLESKYQYAIGGAILAELLILERIRLQKPKRKQLIEQDVGEGICMECGAKISNHKCPNCDSPQE